MTDKLSASNAMSLPARLGYGVGIYGPMLGWVAASQFLLYFYTDVAGIDPARAGLIFMCGMIWDAISDPLVGVISERTKTRWGRYRPYLLFSALPFSAAVALAFFPVDQNTPYVFAIALVTHLLFRTGYTLVYMPYTAMIARITQSYDSRTSLTAIKTMFVFLGNLTISFGFFALVQQLGDGDEAVGFFRAAILVGLVAAATTLICFLATREPPVDDAAGAGPSPSLAKALPDLLRNRAFLLLFTGVAVFGGFYGAEISMTAYFAKYWLGDAGVTRTLFTVQAVASLASIPVWLWLGKRFGKAQVWSAGTLLAAASLLAMFFIRPTSEYGMATLYASANIGATGFILIFYAMTADTVDWGEWKLNRRHEGVIFGAISFANKFASGIVTGALSMALAVVGFVANVEQTPETMNGMFVIGMLLPAIAFAFAACLMWWYPLSRDKHAEIIEEIAAR